MNNGIHVSPSILVSSVYAQEWDCWVIWWFYSQFFKESPYHLPQWLYQPRCPLTDEWIRKLLYIYTMEYYSAIKRNTFQSVLMMWMNLEPILQSDVSQKEKDKYHILTHIYVIQKNGTEEFIYRATMEETDMERGEERVRCMQRVTWKLTLPYVKQIANRNLLYGSVNSNRGSGSTYRDREGDEREVQK